LFESRHQASSAILAGDVLVNGQKLTKAGMAFDINSTIEVVKKPKYVSRGGQKLEKALGDFDIEVQDKIALDIGASTGGFTDVLLQQEAKKVIAIDVGYGQFSYKLRNNPHVELFERTNIRDFKPGDLQELADIAVVDLSFISVLKVIDNIVQLLKPEADLVILIKPQFEAGKGVVGKGGVVRDKNVHLEVLTRIADNLEKGLQIKGLIFSPIRGPKGNIEFFYHLTKTNKRVVSYCRKKIKQVVESSHEC